MRHPVPVLITWDVDPDEWLPIEGRQETLNQAMDICHQLNIPATFFFTANGAYVYSSEIVTKLQTQGHEVGCHGLTHEDEEDYDRMSKELQDAYVSEATQKLTSLFGIPPRVFRAPRVKVSAYTLEQLSRYGYWGDSSVCSQRMDVISSNLINTGWLRAPRRPYHPHRNDVYRRGNVPIWEVPISAMIIPFISSVLKVLGLGPMKVLFRLLYAESWLTGKPIVYLAHPGEFGRRQADQQQRRPARSYLTSRYLTLSYIRTHGFLVRKVLYRVGGEALLARTQDLFAFMTSFPGVTFMTMSEYISHYNF